MGAGEGGVELLFKLSFYSWLLWTYFASHSLDARGMPDAPSMYLKQLPREWHLHQVCEQPVGF